MDALFFGRAIPRLRFGLLLALTPRKIMKTQIFAIVSLFCFIVASPFSLTAAEYDVVIYGGTSAAVTTAVQVKKMGKTVVIVSPDKHLGGLSSGGLGFTDSGNVGTVGGLSRAFYGRVYEVYQRDETWRWQKMDAYANVGQGTKAMLHADRTMWIFEPHVAEAVFDAWVAEMEIPVVRDTWLDRENGVKKGGARITEIVTLCGKTFRGKMFVDATYEGDLLAAAGVDFHVGREANSQYDETWNGNQVGILHHNHFFAQPVDPYVVVGCVKSGLLKYVDASEPGVRGEADDRVQAYCFRLCMTDHEPNRMPFPKPEGYNADDYELLARTLAGGWRDVFGKFDRIPNHKTDTNNCGPFSLDAIGINYAYPNATYDQRREIIEEHEIYQKGLLYFLANDARVPEDLRVRMSRWGLAKDEFLDNGHWPHQLYIREARRMVGEYVTTEHECLGRRECPRPVGMGSYVLDSHNVRRYVKPDGFVQNEGDIGVHPPRPYGIDYGSLVPKRGQCANLLVPVCVSCTHIAFGSIRMEPVFMILGQSAGTAAVMAIDENLAVQDVDYEKLAERLMADGQRLTHDGGGHGSVAVKDLEGTVVDNRQAELVGDWVVSQTQPQYVGHEYIHDNNSEKGEKSVTFRVKVPQPGVYEVRLAYSALGNRATNVPVTITHADGAANVTVNQQKTPPVDDLFISLGRFSFTDTAVIRISTAGTNGFVIADAVQLLP